MTVKELIAELTKQNPDMQVVVYGGGRGSVLTDVYEWDARDVNLDDDCAIASDLVENAREVVVVQ